MFRWTVMYRDLEHRWYLVAFDRWTIWKGRRVKIGPSAPSDETARILADVHDSLAHLIEVSRQAPDPTRGILAAQIFIIQGKVSYLLGRPY